ncbi:At2g23090 like protein [Hyaloraphidium curvatum]|nr:At2g23090 like protein [Hyaloraphidium curvatum]
MGCAAPRLSSLSSSANGETRNGAKAASKRERKAEGGPKEAKSQLKVNEAAKNIVCQVCRSNFLCTTRLPALEEHAANKHSKTAAECFPGFKEMAK